jgi:hypothetical protein
MINHQSANHQSVNRLIADRLIANRPITTQSPIQNRKSTIDLIP